jgi:hypothetical protein
MWKTYSYVEVSHWRAESCSSLFPAVEYHVYGETSSLNDLNQSLSVLLRLMVRLCLLFHFVTWWRRTVWQLQTAVWIINSSSAYSWTRYVNLVPWCFFFFGPIRSLCNLPWPAGDVRLPWLRSKKWCSGRETPHVRALLSDNCFFALVRERPLLCLTRTVRVGVPSASRWSCSSKYLNKYLMCLP